MTSTWRRGWRGLRAWFEGRCAAVAREIQAPPGAEAEYACARQRTAELLYARNRLEAEAAHLRRELAQLSPWDPRTGRLAREAEILEVQAHEIRGRAEQAKDRLLELRDAFRSLERHRLFARAAGADERLAGDPASDVDLRTAEMDLDRELGHTRAR